MKCLPSRKPECLRQTSPFPMKNVNARFMENGYSLKHCYDNQASLILSLRS